jgi:glycosyltransferase involved in cell wall biosynthesis
LAYPAGAVLLSIVVPVYNEQATLEELLDRLVAIDCGCRLELIAVDDGSTDRSPELLARLAEKHPELRLVRHAHNRGKGAALRSGFRAATGDVWIVQDADLEYDPADIPRVIDPIRRGLADVVYGSRFDGTGPQRVQSYWQRVFNRLLTRLSNMLTDLDLRDMEVCYKAFRREVLAGIELVEDGFGIEPEITAKIARRGLRIYQVTVSYQARGYDQGKKITWQDGLRTLFCILKYNLWARG